MLSLILVTTGLVAFGGSVGYLSAVNRRNKDATNYYYHKEQMDKIENFEKNGGYKVVDIDKIANDIKGEL